MKVFDFELAKYVINSCGLDHPERLQMVTYTRKTALLDLYNAVRGKAVPYVVWKDTIYLSSVSRYRKHLDRVVLRDILQEAQRSNWKGFKRSLRNDI